MKDFIYDSIPEPEDVDWGLIPYLPYSQYRHIAEVWQDVRNRYRKVVFRDGTVAFYKGPFFK